MFRITPGLGSRKRAMLLLESICTIQFKIRTNYVKMSRLRQHSSKHITPYFVINCGNVWGLEDQPCLNPDAIDIWPANLFSDITHRQILLTGMSMNISIYPVGLVRWTNDWQYPPFSRKLICCIPPPVSHAHCAVNAIILEVSKEHQFEIVVCLKWEMYTNQLYTFENVHAVLCSKDKWVIFNSIIITKPKNMLTEEH